MTVGISYKTTELGDTPVTTSTPLPTTITTFGGAANLATGQITGTTAGTTAVVAARATRRSVTIRHFSAANTAFIGPSGVTTSSGFPLLTGESVALDFTGAVEVICTGGAVVLVYADVYA
jgi:hypothetical protein